jgi:hypothetical protein
MTQTSRERPRLAARVGLTFGFLCFILLVDWLITSEASPFYQYLLWHVAVGNFWARINLGPHLLGVAVSGNIHQGSLAGYLLGLLLQWGTIGTIVSLLVVRGRRTGTR